uniref:DUF1758 domain-containing protein n=1 Tax=Haemonchus contortus TaxID=6289 RepID=W6NR83_HAECO
MCFSCGGAHHTSCCFKVSTNIYGKSKTGNAQEAPSATRTLTTIPKKENHGENAYRRAQKAHSQVNATTETSELGSSDDARVESAILQHEATTNKSTRTHPCLPVGELTIVDTDTRALVKVHVLLDTGAELSFIDSSLANRLHLPVQDTKEVQLATFGSQEVKRIRCNRVHIDVWDAEGNPHNLELLTHNVLTRSLETPELSVDDREFIRSLNLPMTWRNDNKKLTPSILLGCDQLWSFVQTNEPSIPLPSGMHILPTKMGYLVSGRPKLENKNVFQVSQQLQDEAKEWEKLWSMDLIQQYTISSTGNKIPQEEDKENMGNGIDKDKITLTPDRYIQKVDQIASEIGDELVQILEIVPDQNNSCPQGKNTMEVQAKENDEMTKRAVTSASPPFMIHFVGSPHFFTDRKSFSKEYGKTNMAGIKGYPQVREPNG